MTKLLFRLSEDPDHIWQGGVNFAVVEFRNPLLAVLRKKLAAFLADDAKAVEYWWPVNFFTGDTDCTWETDELAQKGFLPPANDIDWGKSCFVEQPRIRLIRNGLGHIDVRFMGTPKGCDFIVRTVQVGLDELEAYLPKGEHQ